MSKETKTSNEKHRFYRSSMPSIVWDPANDRPLADFTSGHFTTDDPVVVEKLRQMGYVEIPLDAIEPPPDIVVRPPKEIIEGDIPVMQGAQGAKVIEQKMDRVPKKTVNTSSKSKTVAPKKAIPKKKEAEKTNSKKLKTRRKK